MLGEADHNIKSEENSSYGQSDAWTDEMICWDNLLASMQQKLGAFNAAATHLGAYGDEDGGNDETRRFG